MKTIDGFVQLVANQFYETDTSMFKPDTRLNELDEWSSLTAVSIMAMIVEEFGVALNAKDVVNVFTIEDLYNLVKSRM